MSARSSFVALCLLASASSAGAASITFSQPVSFGTAFPDGDSNIVWSTEGLFDPSLGTATGWQVTFSGAFEGSARIQVTDGDPGQAVSGVVQYVGDMTLWAGTYAVPFAVVVGSHVTDVEVVSCAGVGSCDASLSTSGGLLFDTGLESLPLPDFLYMGVTVGGPVTPAWVDYSFVGDFADVGGSSGAAGTATLTVFFDPIPEPATAALLLAGLVGLTVKGRKVR